MQTKRWHVGRLVAAALFLAALPLHAEEFAPQAQRLPPERWSRRWTICSSGIAGAFARKLALMALGEPADLK